MALFSDRNRAKGVEWGFKIVSQKSAKHSKSDSHNWKSVNYDVLEDKFGDKEPGGEPIRRKRSIQICIFIYLILFCFPGSAITVKTK